MAGLSPAQRDVWTTGWEPTVHTLRRFKPCGESCSTWKGMSLARNREIFPTKAGAGLTTAIVAVAIISMVAGRTGRMEEVVMSTGRGE